MEFYGKLKVMETGREEVEQREQEKGLAEKGAANGRKRSRKGSGIGVRKIFCQGGAVNHLPKKIQRIFPKHTVEKKRGPYDATTEAALAYEGGSIL